MIPSQIVFRPIGIVHSKHTKAERTPVQPCYAADCAGTVEVFPEYAAGLKDIEGYSHIYLLYYLHRASAASLLVRPFLQDVERGLFATRAPCRPNPVGMSIVRLLGREDNLLRIRGVDILDGTPLLDIKPYAARFDCIADTRNGWQDEVGEEEARKRGRRDFDEGKTTGA